MKKSLKIIIIVLLFILILTTISYATGISLKLEEERQEDTILLHIKLDKINNEERGISGFVTDIEYDKNVFETIKDEDIILQNGWTDKLYNENTNSLLVLRNNVIKESGTDIVQIKLNKKANINIQKTQVKLTDIQATDSQKDIDIADMETEIRFSGIALEEILLGILIALTTAIALLFILRFIIKGNNKRRIKR